MTGRKKKYKTLKIKTFLFFLLLALVFWVLTKFSKESTATIGAHLVYTNLPASISISPNSTQEVSFDVSANGFQFLSYKMESPTIDIDISKYYETGDTLVLISNSELTKIISSQLDINTRVNNLSIDELEIRLDTFISKKVAVVFISEITYAEGYRLVDIPILTPDSVTVSGPSEMIDRIVVIPTKNYVKKGVSETIIETIDFEKLMKNSQQMLLF